MTLIMLFNLLRGLSPNMKIKIGAVIVAIYTLTVAGSWWAGNVRGQSVARAVAAQEQADALAASLAKAREAADQIAADRIALEKVKQMLDKRTSDIRRLEKQLVEHDNLQTWYQSDANSVERLALYGMPPPVEPGIAVPDIGSLPDYANTHAVAQRAGEPRTIH